jgi:protein-L-isoaspartate(D-aspartate) O-methyltransferase
MVGQLRDGGVIRSAAVASVMEMIPRHLFVPDVPLETAYGSGPVVTHRDDDGVAISSASAPGMVAGMLEQLDVRDGHRILEIGAGTGYNAALLAQLVGRSGAVTTIEYDEVVAGSARKALDRAGCEAALIIGDGMSGWAAGAPYDRIIVTAGAWDVAAAWRDQLADGGLLLVPLRMAGLTRAVALRRDGRMLRSESMAPCGFIPLRGGAAVGEQNVWVGGKDGDLLLRIDDGAQADADAAGRALEFGGVTAWTGVGFVMPEILDFWLARTPGFCRVLASRQAVEAGRIVSPLFPWGSMGVLRGGTVAYLTAAADLSEVGVAAYGPDSQALAGEVAARIREWDAAGGPGMTVQVEVHPRGDQVPPGAWLVLDKTDSQVVISMS